MCAYANLMRGKNMKKKPTDLDSNSQPPLPEPYYLAYLQWGILGILRILIIAM